MSSPVFVDGKYTKIGELTTEQVYYLIQCKPIRLSLDQLEQWRKHNFDAGVKEEKCRPYLT
jgi:hypothetical protein